MSSAISTYPASIDPPGKGQDRTVPSLSLRDEFSREDFIQMMQSFEPYTTLPRILLPKPQAGLMPPVMHYGWVLKEAGALQAYADENGAGGLDLFSSLIAQFLTGGGRRREEDYDDYDYDDPDEPRRPALDPMQARLLQVTRLQSALLAIGHETGIPYPPGLIKIVPLLSAGDDSVISLYTNFDLHRVPSDAFIEALRVRLGEAEPPKWYLDGMLWQWRPRPRRAPDAENEAGGSGDAGAEEPGDGASDDEQMSE